VSSEDSGYHCCRVSSSIIIEKRHRRTVIDCTEDAAIVFSFEVLVAVNVWRPPMEAALSDSPTDSFVLESRKEGSSRLSSFARRPSGNMGFANDSGEASNHSSFRAAKVTVGLHFRGNGPCAPSCAASQDLTRSDSYIYITNEQPEKKCIWDFTSCAQVQNRFCLNLQETKVLPALHGPGLNRNLLPSAHAAVKSVGN